MGLKLFGACPKTLLNGSDGVLMDDIASPESHRTSQAKAACSGSSWAHRTAQLSPRTGHLHKSIQTDVSLQLDTAEPWHWSVIPSGLSTWARPARSCWQWPQWPRATGNEATPELVPGMGRTPWCMSYHSTNITSGTSQDIHQSRWWTQEVTEHICATGFVSWQEQ